MRRFFFLSCLLIGLAHLGGNAQAPAFPDSINNLVLPVRYPTAGTGAIPHFTKAGKGKITLILIPGLGFDETVFRDFQSANKKQYTTYAVTIPGFGRTQAPRMPPPGTSYGERTWMNSLIEGLEKLIREQKIKNPVLVGHFALGAQVAMLYALKYPNQVKGLICIGAPGKFIPIQNGKPMLYSAENRVKGVDQFSAKFFQKMTKQYWDNGNYLPDIYSMDSVAGKSYWKQVAETPMPVIVRYLLEYQTCDILTELSMLNVPIMILRPGFRPDLLDTPENPNTNYIKPQFIESWEMLRTNPKVQIVDIPRSGSFTWHDKPQETDAAIKGFLGKVKKK
ncbi:MAG: alpha/beta hydrolase [Cyclobacteriaceae bacterium]|nr:alpha/beta hydrolase [Cyclobacteriaceae bacterium]